MNQDWTVRVAMDVRAAQRSEVRHGDIAIRYW